MIRKATIADSTSITQIQLDAWRHNYIKFIPDKILESLSFERRKDKWEELLRAEAGRLTLFELEGKPVGFLHLDVPLKDSIELLRLYVSPEVMHKGVGSALISEALSYIKEQKIPRVVIWVAELNTIARNFYEKHGFKYVSGPTRIDSFSIDGSPPTNVYEKSGAPTVSEGEFKEVYYTLES